MSITASYTSACTVKEVLDGNPDSASATNRTVTHNAFNNAVTLNATSTPPATKVAAFKGALSSGALTIDLTSLTGTNGATVTMSGLKVQVFKFKNLGANAMTIVGGATNGYLLFGTDGSVIVPPGAEVMFFTNDGVADVGTTTKTLDITGTAAQTFEATIVGG